MIVKCAQLEKRANPLSMIGDLVHHAAPWIGQAANHPIVSPLLDALHSPAGYMGMAASTLPGLVVGSSLNDIPKLLMRKGNKLSSWLTKSTLADGIVALKKAGEGKAMSNATALGVLAHGHPSTQAKTIALSGFNHEVMKHPFVAEAAFRADKPNRLDVKSVKEHLESAKELRQALDRRISEARKRLAAKAKAGAPLFASDDEVAHRITQRIDRYSHLANKVADPARHFLDQAHELHTSLNAHDGHGYGLLDGAARKAETALGRRFNIMDKLYQPVDAPNQGNVFQKIRNLAFGGVLGQRKHTPNGPMSLKDYVAHGHPDDVKTPAAAILAERKEKEQNIVKQLNSRDNKSAATELITPTGPRKTILHEDVVEALRSGSLLQKTKAELDVPLKKREDGFFEGFLNRFVK